MADKKTAAHFCFEQLEAEIENFINTCTDEILKTKFLEESPRYQQGVHIVNVAGRPHNKIIN